MVLKDSRFYCLGFGIDLILYLPLLSTIGTIVKKFPMTPYFLRNLIPKKEKVERTRPLLEVLRSLTLAQWGLFISGQVALLTTSNSAELWSQF